MKEQLFFELIQVAIGTRICFSHTPSADEWGKLYEMAKKQSLVGVCFAGVQKLQTQRQEPPEMLYLTWMGMAAKIQQRNEVVNRQCVELQKQLSADGLCCVILKGQGNALLYGDLRNLRQSGDIDAWVNAPFEDVMKFVNGIAPTREVTHQHVHYHIFDDTVVELHFIPSELEFFYHNRKLQQFYESQKKSIFSATRLVARCKDIMTPTNEFNLVFQLSHIYRHLFGDGIGLRQVMDYYFLLSQSSKDERDIAYRVIKLVGMEKFCKALMFVLHTVFDLSSDFYLCEDDSHAGKVLLEDMLESGNFGSVRGNVINDNWWKRTVRFTRHNTHLLSYYPTEVIADPFWRLWHWSWRKRKGFK